MRIGIDASRAFSRQRTGIEEYSYRIVEHLRNKLGNNPVVLYIRKNQKVDLTLPENWKIKIIKFPYLWTQLGLSLELLFHPVDVLFIPAHVVPCIHPKNTFVTIHGLEYEFFPEGYSWWAKLYMRWSIKFSCRWTKKIIAVSKNTKKDLMELYKVPENKVEVIYEGVSLVIASKAKQSRSDDNEIATVATLPRNDKKPYLLFIGRLEKRKNIEGIILTFEILKEKYKIPHKLVLAGKYGYGEDDIKDKIDNFKYKDEIIMPGFVRDEDKGELIKNADVFLFPTFYEGFGLPILEAQNLGVPVVTSNISSLSEVGGKSVFYADPQETEIIADTVFKLLNDYSLKDDIIRKGYENVKRFSWEKCADEIAKLLNS
jgi:glycosyltransferase involved in cell wall biosynthesis